MTAQTRFSLSSGASWPAQIARHIAARALLGGAALGSMTLGSTLLGSTLLGASTAAHAGANDVAFRSTHTVMVGAQPSLSFTANRVVSSLTLSLKGQPRQARGAKRRPRPIAFEKRLKAVKVGKPVTITLPHKKAGQVAWSGKVSVVFADGGTGEMPLSFTTAVLAPPTFDLAGPGIELDKQQLTLSADQNVKQVDIDAFGDDGEVVGRVTWTAGALAGTPATIKWRQRDKNAVVLRLDVRVTSTSDVHQTIQWFPWHLDLPHEEVVFASGSADIDPAEVPKLEAVMPALNTSIKRYGKVARVRLFVAGHTDTVGAADTNRALSARRARSIAKWFVARGYQIEIYARGFGESRLRVATPDGTDEAANRRADYTLATNPPQGSMRQWKRVR